MCVCVRGVAGCTANRIQKTDMKRGENNYHGETKQWRWTMNKSKEKTSPTREEKRRERKRRNQETMKCQSRMERTFEIGNGCEN